MLEGSSEGSEEQAGKPLFSSRMVLISMPAAVIAACASSGAAVAAWIATSASLGGGVGLLAALAAGCVAGSLVFLKVAEVLHRLVA
jgi:outer membrane lipoprotein SlyB